MRLILSGALISVLVPALGCTNQPTDPGPTMVFNATVDGQPFVPDTLDIRLYQGSVLQILALQFSADGRHIGFLVSVDSFAAPATYLLRQPATQKRATFEDYTNLRLAYLTQPGEPGNLTIEAIDTARKMVRGTFSFVAHGYLPQQEDSSAAIDGTFLHSYVQEP